MTNSDWFIVDSARSKKFLRMMKKSASRAKSLPNFKTEIQKYRVRSGYSSEGQIIRERARQTLIRSGNKAVMWGDVGLLDMIAVSCYELNLLDLHPLPRHQKILNALDRSKDFHKSYIRLPGQRGNSMVRCFTLKAVIRPSDWKWVYGHDASQNPAPFPPSKKSSRR